jgi:hypothetical protein
MSSAALFEEIRVPDQDHNDDTTRAVAHLPGLDIEIMHQRSTSAERISIHLQAMPSFEAFGQAIKNADPFVFWVKAAQLASLAWAPWLAWNPLSASWLDATRTLLPPDNLEGAPPTIPEQ